MYERAFWSMTKQAIFHACCLFKKMNVNILESLLPLPTPGNFNPGSVTGLSNFLCFHRAFHLYEIFVAIK